MQVVLKIKSDNLERKLAAAPLKLKVGLSRAIKKSALLVERSAKQRAPVDTGRMRASIGAEVRGITAVIKPNVKYAIFVHEGTRYMKGRPFMAEGFKLARSAIQKVLTVEIRNVLA